MTDIITTAQWYDRGLDDAALRSRVAKGTLTRLRRGSYAVGPESPTSEQAHLLAIRATLPELDERAIVSHVSAAIVHGLPVLRASIGKVQVTRPDRPRGKSSRTTQRLTGSLDQVDVTEVQGVRVTSLARTLVDLGRSQPLGWAVAAMDQALHEQRITKAEVNAALERLGPVRGTRQAQRMVLIAQPRSESVGESLSRVVFAEAGLPEAALQVRFRDGQGDIGRVDFYWREQRVIGEFDGMAKYDELARPGEDARSVFRREKTREDRLRALGHVVVRWTWDELFHTPEVVVARLRRAFETAARARDRAA